MKSKCRKNGPACALLIVALMLVSVFTMFAAATDTEPNDSYNEADPISEGSHNGHVNDTDKDDIFVIDMDAGQTIYVKALPNASLGISLYLYLKIGNDDPVEAARDQAPLVGYIYGVLRKANYTVNSQEETYNMYILITREKGDGNYDLDVTLFSQDDANSDTDAKDDFETDIEVFEDDYDGYLKEGDNDDYYMIRAEPGQTIFVTAEPEISMALDIQLYQAQPQEYTVDYIEVAKDKSPGQDQGFGETRRMEFTLTAEEMFTSYYLRAHRASGYGNYTFEIDLFDQNDGGYGSDAPASEINAPEIGDVPSFTGHMRGLDISDFYLFNLTDRQGLELKVTPEETLAVNLEVFEEVAAGSGTRLVSKGKVEAPGSGIGLGMVREINHTIGKQAYAHVYLETTVKEGYGNYTVDVTVIPKPPDVTPPTIVINEPQQGQKFKSKEIIVMGTAVDDDSGTTRVEITADNITWLVANGTNEWQVTLKLPHKGNNTIWVRATDAAGNTAQKSIWIKVKKDEGGPGFEAVALVTAIIVGLAVLTRRRR